MKRKERKNMGFTLPVELLDRLKTASEESMIPQARIVEKGIEMMLDKVEQQKEA